MSQNQLEIQYAVFLAIDWADQKHAWSLQEANSRTFERGEVDHMPEAIEAWVAPMSQRVHSVGFVGFLVWLFCKLRAVNAVLRRYILYNYII